ncbi:MAG: hypothetical protein IJM19_07290, partial [Ruminococcus sp.]|nr:hypothetical protein [Ruminococcus sp.]
MRQTYFLYHGTGEILMNNMEKMILDIWKDVLKNDNIELDDNFFDVGGTSLKALEIVEKCKKSGIIIPIYKMFT